MPSALTITQIMAGMVIGYINETVFVAIIGVTLFQLLASLAVMFYYMRKMSAQDRD